MVVFCYWLHQIGDLFYNAYEYQDVELKNTVEINWLFRNDCQKAKAGEDPCQRRHLFGKESGMKSHLQGKELSARVPRLWAWMLWQWAKEIANKSV